MSRSRRHCSANRLILLITLLVVLILLIIFIGESFIQNSEGRISSQIDSNQPIILECESQLFDNPRIEQADECLLRYIRQHHLTPPPATRNISKNYETSEWGTQLRAIFNETKNGFYIEAGANDGEYLSNTNYLDKSFNWTGILIEPNSFLLPALRSSSRNAWISDACLSIRPYPQKVKFLHRVGARSWYKGNGRIKPNPGEDGVTTVHPKTRNIKDYVGAGNVECFPLYSILSAMNVSIVDYFSLDVEGVEFQVLENIPFDKLNIKVISVEFNSVPEGKAALLELLQGNGYEVLIETYRELFMVLTKNRI